MTFLRTFLSRCTIDELHKLKQLELKGNEQKVLLETIRQRDNTDCSDEEIQNKFQLSKSYFDKINSVLLNKCTAALTNNGNYEAILSFYQLKDLPDLFKHDLKIWARKFEKEKNEETLVEFYYTTFQLLRRLPASKFDDALTEYYMKQYLKYKKDACVEDIAEVNFMLEATRVFVKVVAGKIKTYEKEFLKKMEALYATIEGKPYYRAHFHAQLAWANYYDFCTNDFSKLVEALNRALKYYDKAKSKINQNYKMYAITKLAKAYCQGSQFKDAMKIYQEAFDLFGEQLARNPYHPTMYAVVAIINGKYAEAEKMMDENLLHLLHSEKPGTIDFDIYRTYAILYMNQSMFDKAFYYLEEALKFPRTNVSLLGDILLRIVHNAFFILNGDLATAKKILARNFKFLATKEGDAMVQEYILYFKIMRQIINHREGKKEFKNFKVQLVPFQEGITKLYGDLFYKMMQ